MKTQKPVLFFDAAYTLIKPRAKLGEIYAEVAHRFNHNPNPEALTAQFSPVFHDLKRGRTRPVGVPETPEETRSFWSSVIAEIFRRAGEPLPPEPYTRELFDEFTTDHCWLPYSDAAATLEQLRERGYILGVLSNFDFRLERLLQNLGLDTRVDAVVASFQNGFEKPDPNAYRSAAACFPEASCFTMIGDHWGDDVQGALNAGWSAVWVDRDGVMSSAPENQSEAIPHIRQLADLLELFPA